MNRLIAVLLFAVGTVVAAADTDAVYLEQCRSLLVERYGPEVQVKLVSVRRSSAGLLLKVAVSTVEAESGKVSARFTDCRLTRAQLEAAADRQGPTAPAGAEGSLSGG